MLRGDLSCFRGTSRRLERGVGAHSSWKQRARIILKRIIKEAGFEEGQNKAPTLTAPNKEMGLEGPVLECPEDQLERK